MVSSCCSLYYVKGVCILFKVYKAVAAQETCTKLMSLRTLCQIWLNWANEFRNYLWVSYTYKDGIIIFCLGKQVYFLSIFHMVKEQINFGRDYSNVCISFYVQFITGTRRYIQVTLEMFMTDEKNSKHYHHMSLWGFFVSVLCFFPPNHMHFKFNK